MKYRDYYDILGISRSASAQEIQRAYRKLARQYHPDVNKAKGGEEKLKQLNEAYEVLGDPEKRKRYDALGSNWQSGQDFRPPPGFENVFFSFGNMSGSGSHERMSGFSDFFQSLFGGGFGAGPESFFERSTSFSGASEAARGQEAEIQLSVEDIYKGERKSISLETIEMAASGRGERKVRSYEIRIPPGTTDGSTIRLAGQAEAGHRGARVGDILLHVRVAPHPYFRVMGFDLLTPLPISPWEAALGAKIPVRLVDDEIKLTIPAGAQSGQKLRIRGRGLRESPQKRGDLFVELQIQVPNRLSAGEREHFEALARDSNFNPRRK